MLGVGDCEDNLHVMYSHSGHFLNNALGSKGGKLPQMHRFMTSPCILSHLTYVATTTICVDARVYTCPKTNMKPENDEFQKGICCSIGLFSVPRGRCHRQCWRNGCWQCGVTRPVSGNLKLIDFHPSKNGRPTTDRLRNAWAYNGNAGDT